MLESKLLKETGDGRQAPQTRGSHKQMPNFDFTDIASHDSLETLGQTELTSVPMWGFQIKGNHHFLRLIQV